MVSSMVRLEERECSLALVDLMLPDGDGLHLLRLLKAKDPSLEVIIMTGHSSIAKAVEATKQGAFYFVAKPFDTDEMLMPRRQGPRAAPARGRDLGAPAPAGRAVRLRADARGPRPR